MRWWITMAAALVLAGALSVPAAADPMRSRQWGLDLVRADPARATVTGSGAVVAVVDSGAQLDHPDLAGRLLPGHDFVDDDAVPQDGDGHGTHVAGIASAVTGNGIGVESVAPGAAILPVRVLDDTGRGRTVDVADGIDWAVAHGAHVINLSLGSDVPLSGAGPSAFDGAINRALDAGVIVVAASGNTGMPACGQPSGQGRLLCVGAVDRRANRAFFSSFGQGLGLVAPGGSAFPLPDEDVWSTYKGSSYAEIAGTSQAAPFVSGVAALLVSTGLRGQDVTQRLLATARDLGPPGPDPESGAGIVDAAAAVDGLRPAGAGVAPAAGPAVSPGEVPASSGKNGAAGRVRLRRRQPLGAVRRRGIVVHCLAAGAGRCTVEALVRRKVIATGSGKVRPGKVKTVRAKLNRRGHALARTARKLSVLVRVKLPGSPPIERRVVLRR